MTYRLLVVAGENEVLRALPQQLGDSVIVKVMDSANDALWEVRSDPPEAVIAEVELDGMSGMDLAEILPNFEVPTRVLLWSRSPNEALRQQAAAANAKLVGATTSQSDLHAVLRAAMEEAKNAPPPPEPEPEPEPAPPPPPVSKADRAAERAERAERLERERIERERAERAEKAEKAGFTPARITLPPVDQRNTPAPPPPAPPARGGLAARTRTAVEKNPPSRPAPTPPPPPAPEPPPPVTRRNSGTLVVTADNITPIRSVMSQLGQDLGAQSIMLTDRAGMVLVEVGSTVGLPMMILLPLLSTSFSTAGEVARQLRDEDATTLYIHEGVNIDLYCFDVVQRFLLVLVFNKKVASSKIGAVWVNAKRSIRELRDLLARAG